MDMIDKIKDLAASEGFDKTVDLGSWSDLRLFLADTSEDCFVGLPQYILASDREVRWASPSETDAIMASLS